MKYFYSLLFLLLSLSSIAQELRIYNLHYTSNNRGLDTRFVPLSDEFYMRHPLEHEVIDLQYLKGEMDEDHNYHFIESEYRTNLLKQVGIKESDKIFAFVLSEGVVHEINVKETKIAAFVSIYGPEYPLTEEQYMIGFELINSFPDGAYSSTDILVYIGEESPFDESALEALVFMPIADSLFPDSQEPGVDRYIDGKEPGTVFLHTNATHNYYLQNYGSMHRAGVRHIIITTLDGEYVTETIFRDSEGTYLHPITSPVAETAMQYQWTGSIIKGKSPVLLGFYSQSFGCPSIHFIDEKDERIWIGCDNRH